MSQYVNPVYESIVANGTDITSTAVLNPNCLYHNITTSVAGNYAVRLGILKIGSVHRIKTSASVALSTPVLILPNNAFSSISGGAAGTGFYLPAYGGECSIVVTANNNDANPLTGPIITYEAFEKKGDVSITLPAANYVVPVSENGTTYVLPAPAAAGRTITLPALANGLKYKFVVNATIGGGHSWVISAPANTMDGISQYQTTAATTGQYVPAIALTTATLGAGAVTGSTLEASCDGVKWNVVGLSTLNNVGWVIA